MKEIPISVSRDQAENFRQLVVELNQHIHHKCLPTTVKSGKGKGSMKVPRDEMIEYSREFVEKDGEYYIFLSVIVRFIKLSLEYHNLRLVIRVLELLDSSKDQNPTSSQ